LQFKLNGVYTRLISTYCSVPDIDETPEGITFCNLSSHFGQPLSEEELNSLLVNFNEIEELDFRSCLTISKQRNKDTLLRASKLGIRRLGTAVVDCKYNVPFASIDDAICKSQPNIEPCKTDE